MNVLIGAPYFQISQLISTKRSPRLTIDANTNIGRSSLNTPAVIVISL